MLNYIETKDESACCGCRACEQICPVNAIAMKKNKEGFIYPVLDSDLCVNCQQCEKVCPQMRRPDGVSVEKIFAVQHKDEEILAKSSSGGAFRLLADEVISSGGCVVGCVWNENFEPILKIADTFAELEPMQGSKYLSSSTEDTYKKVEERLKNGQQVLFTGAPCQCAGLIKFLGKPYANLLTADFLCHGMPSQQVFDCYLDYVEKKLGIFSHEKKRAITSFKFRDKGKKGWGKVSSYTWEKNGKQYKKYGIEMTDSYICGFSKGYFSRYSCYTCLFRGEKRFTDFTFCDYWGVNNFHPEINAGKGVSALSINSEKAEQLRRKLVDKITWIETKATDVARENPTLLKDFKEQFPELRKNIYFLLENNGWQTISKKYFRDKNYYLLRILYAMPRSFVKILKKVLKVG